VFTYNLACQTVRGMLEFVVARGTLEAFTFVVEAGGRLIAGRSLGVPLGQGGRVPAVGGKNCFSEIEKRRERRRVAGGN